MTMIQKYQIYINGQIFDGMHLHENLCLAFNDGIASHIGPRSAMPQNGEIIDLKGDILSPGFVDLQVNGGGGVMFNDNPSPEILEILAKTHRALGVRAILPTLITDRKDKTEAAIQAAIQAVEMGIQGIAGLHLEGPHISALRKGAHDEGLIRPMSAEDCTTLLKAKDNLPALMVTIAPENTTIAQVKTLAKAGIVLSLGHSDSDYETAMRYFDAGVQCATHLFNAMSPLTSRAPGVVGAALNHEQVYGGLIADGIHVHPHSLEIAWRAKKGKNRLFLVSDAMAIAGTDDVEFFLEGRKITRHEGALTLEDGTLAGADLDIVQAIFVLTQKAQIPLNEALKAATSLPAKLIGLADFSLEIGKTQQSDMIRIAPSLKNARFLS